MYECATGRHPFPGKTSAVILAAILNRSPVAPITINPELPLRLQEVINNCLEKDRELRYQSAADLRADLKRLRRDIESGHSWPAVPVAPRPASSDPRSPGSPMPVAPRDQQGARPAPAPSPARRTAIVALVAVTLLAAGAYGLWRGMATTPPATETRATRPAIPFDATLESRLSQARSSLDERDYRAALTHAGAVLAVDADHAEATRIRDEARTALARFDEAIAQAREHLAAGDAQAAARSLEVARAHDPSAPSVGELSARISDLVRQREAAERDAAARDSAARQAARDKIPSRESAKEPQPPREASRPAPATAPPPVPAPVDVSPPVPTPPPPPAPEPTPPATTPPPTTTPPARPEPSGTPAPGTTTSVPAPPPAEPRPTEPVKPAPSPSEADDAAIRKAVATYGRAIENKDVALFRSIKPNMSGDEERRLQQGFRAVASQRVFLTIASIERRGDTASVVVRRRDELEIAGRRQTVEAKQTLSLARAGDGWVIVEIR
jgi:hypothetical protein